MHNSPQMLLDSLVVAANRNSLVEFDAAAILLWEHLLGGGERPRLRGWNLGKQITSYSGSIFSLVMYDTCPKRWMILELSTKKFYRMRG